jgi:hypothetical protein
VKLFSKGSALQILLVSQFGDAVNLYNYIARKEVYPALARAWRSA